MSAAVLSYSFFFFIDKLKTAHTQNSVILGVLGLSLSVILSFSFFSKY